LSKSFPFDFNGVLCNPPFTPPTAQLKLRWVLKVELFDFDSGSSVCSPDGNQCGGGNAAKLVLQLALVPPAIGDGHILDEETAGAAYLIFLRQLHIRINESAIVTPRNLRRCRGKNLNL